MALHNSLSDGLYHGVGYVQSGDPGAVGAGRYWVDTTTGPPYALKVRNSGDSGWDGVGSSFDPTDTTVSWFREDFVKDGDGGSNVSDWYEAFSGGSFPEIASTQAHPGIRALTSGAGATDYAYVGRGNKGIMFGGGATVSKVSINIQNLSDVTDEYDFYWGHLDGIVSTYLDAVYFKYDRNVSANWQIACRNNATETIQTTGTAVATGWITLEIRVNAAGTSASFFVNGSEVTNSPITTNIPTTRDTGHVTIIQKSAGTASRAVWFDYWFFKQTLTSAR